MTWTIADSRRPFATVACGRTRRTRSSISMVGPTLLKGSPMAMWAAVGAKMSRPWKLDETTGSHNARFSRTRASTIPPRSSAASIRRPLSGPIRMSPRPTLRATGLRSVPTPGSTTATWTPTGMCGRAKTRLAAPSRIEYRGTWWLMSMMFASGAIPNITPRQTPGAAGPKSLRNVMTGRGTGRAPSGRPDPDGLVDGKTEPRREVALVVGGGNRPRRILVEQRLADCDPDEGRLPGEVDAAGDDPAGSGPIVAGRDLEDQATPRVQRPDGGGELARLAGESGIPEAVD